MSKFCYKCGKEISKDSVFCSNCGAKQEAYDKKFCKQCGGQITENSKFCPICGAKQDDDKNIGRKVQNVSLSMLLYIKDIFKKDENQIEIPNGFHFCSYCGKVQPEENFERTLGEEFNMCNKCYKRSKNIEYATILIPTIIMLIIISIFAVSRPDALGGAMILLIPLSILLKKILGALIKKMLEFTPLRVTLNDKRINKLRETLDVNGKFIIMPIKRSANEEIYYNITKTYFSRDIPDGYYRCPSCEKLHLRKSAKYADNEDNELGGGSTWIGGAYYTITTKEYGSILCPNCYKYKVIDKYIKIAVLLNCLIIAWGLYIYIEGFDWGILGAAFIGGAIGVGVSFIVSFIYKVFVYLICRINLFYKYETAAKYGALTPKK